MVLTANRRCSSIAHPSQYIRTLVDAVDQGAGYMMWRDELALALEELLPIPE